MGHADTWRVFEVRVFVGLMWMGVAASGFYGHEPYVTVNPCFVQRILWTGWDMLGTKDLSDLNDAGKHVPPCHWLNLSDKDIFYSGTEVQVDEFYSGAEVLILTERVRDIFGNCNMWKKWLWMIEWTWVCWQLWYWWAYEFWHGQCNLTWPWNDYDKWNTHIW